MPVVYLTFLAFSISCRLPTPPDTFQPPVFSTLPTAEPIRVATRVCGAKRKNVFYDDHGFPDQSHDFDVLLHNTDGGTVLHKGKHPAPALDDIDRHFVSTYCKATHGARLWTELDLSHLDCTVRNQVYPLIQHYWSVFDDKG